VQRGDWAPATLGSGLHVVEAGPFIVSIARHEAGHALAPHSHATATATVLLGGDYFEECATIRHQLVPLTGVIKPAHEPHTNRIGRRGARSLVVETHDADWTPFFSRPAVLESPELVALLLKVSGEIALEHPSAAVIESLIAEWLCGVERSNRDVMIPAWLYRVRDVIHATSTDDLRLASLASEVGLHPMYVARAFRKAFGRSIGEYAVALRLARAARLLAEGTEHIGRVALKAGYYDHSHMTRDFRSRTGMSPTHWRTIAAA
jgi:AraC family transcriptional regulator